MIVLDSWLSHSTRAHVGLLSSRLDFHENTFSIAARDVEREVDFFLASIVFMDQMLAFETLTCAIGPLDREVDLLL